MNSPKINGSVALVTGANRGIGKAFVESLLRQEAKRVYAAVRDLSTGEALKSAFTEKADRIIPIQLDITNTSEIENAVETCQDVSLLINNAGICHFDKTVEAARSEIETNCFGTWAMCQAFTPVLAKNSGGAIINMMSTASLVNFPMLGSYCVSKVALHSVTQLFRALLASQGTFVAGVYAGPTETKLMEPIDMPKVQPMQIADAVLDATEKGIEDIYPDDYSIQIRDALATDPKAMEKQAGMYI